MHPVLAADKRGFLAGWLATPLVPRADSKTVPWSDPRSNKHLCQDVAPAQPWACSRPAAAAQGPVGECRSGTWLLSGLREES